ncbi:hypothetical protein CFC21_033348 [Triticum aestivum]|uniref:Uncharacterized protein n=2 Tax=Triticum aestivum TaxID=4565 RepID=A0A3B6EC73_WHEAT|nr:hypothetical protein CFC21_033348 [Triticum aestivum]
MEGSSTHVALLLALMVCCSMASSAAAARAFVDGNREGERPPAPWASGRRSAECPGCGSTSSLPVTARLAPHRKNLQVAANVDFYA